MRLPPNSFNWVDGSAAETMTVDESKALKKDTRIYWRGDPATAALSPKRVGDAVTIAWNDGRVARVHRGDMREIQRTPTKPHTV